MVPHFLQRNSYRGMIEFSDPVTHDKIAFVRLLDKRTLCQRARR